MVKLPLVLEGSLLNFDPEVPLGLDVVSNVVESSQDSPRVQSLFIVRRP